MPAAPDPAAGGRLVATPRTRFRAVGEDGVLVHIERGRVSVVNGVGMQLFQWLQQPRSRADLLDLLCVEYEVERAQAAADLELYLDQLSAEGLLQHADPADA
jgi:hypothetical protein